MDAPNDSLIADLLASTDVDHIFGARRQAQAMLDFEAALARVEARLGIIPETAAREIAACCDASDLDTKSLAHATARAGNPAIPLVDALTARVKARDPDAAGYVHWGATSQDVLDSALMLQCRAALRILDARAERLIAALSALAAKHEHTPMAGRTLLQQALPITFGLKAAGWLASVRRARARLQRLDTQSLALQFGGAAGTLAALGTRGLEVAEALARELDLPLPELPWHTHRDRIVEIGTALALLIASLGKIARDVVLLMQTEVAEAFEPGGEGRGGSSTLPQKRNPVSANVVLAAALRAPGLCAGLLTAMVQEHERAVGAWHAEWSLLPELFRLADGASNQSLDMLEGLAVDAARMRANLELTHGLVYAEAASMALASKLGRHAAHALVMAASQRALSEKRTLHEVLAGDPRVTSVIDAGRLAELFEPRNYLGSAQALVQRVLERGKE